MAEYRGEEHRTFRATLTLLPANSMASDHGGSMPIDCLLNSRMGRTIFCQRFIDSPPVGFVDCDNRL